MNRGCENMPVVRVGQFKGGRERFMPIDESIWKMLRHCALLRQDAVLDFRKQIEHIPRPLVENLL